MLGLSLSAIALKSDLALRLIDRDPDRAHAELAAVLDIARHALADVRTVASGQHEMSLTEECATARALLVTAGFEVRIDVPADDGLPPDAGTVLATVLREGVTNVLRHNGERCEITITRRGDEVLLRIVNDGVSAPAVADNGGSGIRNMSDRVAAVDGELSAGTTADGTFTLSARIPPRDGLTINPWRRPRSGPGPRAGRTRRGMPSSARPGRPGSATSAAIRAPSSA